MIRKERGWWIFALLVCVGSLDVYSQGIGKKKKNKNVVYEEVDMDTVEVFPVHPILDYKGAYTQHFQLIHTDLWLEPSFENRQIKGVATLTMRPHFYDQTELVLDAKGMQFDTIAWSVDSFQTPLKYRYDGMKLYVELPHKVTKKDTILFKIPYVAAPHELNSMQNKLGQGGYFINAHKTNPYRKTIFWTQGETEGASAWFPTFDATNQKSTQDFFVVIPDSLMSIANGVLIEQKSLGNGKKVEHWQMRQPHSPYLFALVIGPYLKYEDKWREVPVEYYAFEDFVEYAPEVFGRTPEMMEYFSEIFGYDYPWDNYKQVTVYDFVAGAMENTTLSVFHEGMMCQHNEIWDKNHGEDLIIAHELVHQWFGDLVTCENWANLTLNESFANFGEYLWLEKYKGIDDADVHYYNRFNTYIHEYTYKKVEPIVYHFYKYPNEVFDRHRYDKGGAVLRQLRNYLGNDAFYEGLKLYLNTHAYQSAEIHDLRQAMEKVTGRDLNWFFNQWWLEPGHPIVEATTDFDVVNKEVVLSFYQKQSQHPNVKIPLHRLIFDVDFIYEDTTIRHQMDISNQLEGRRISSEKRPLAINIDPGKTQVWEMIYNYPLEELKVIYDKSDRVIDKVHMIQQLKNYNQYGDNAEFLVNSFDRQHWFVKEKIMENCLLMNDSLQSVLIEKTLPLLTSSYAAERNNALSALQKMKYSHLMEVVNEKLESETSWMVKGNCLRILKDSMGPESYEYVEKFRDVNSPHIYGALTYIMADYGRDEDVQYFEKVLLTILHHYVKDIYENFEKYLQNKDEEVLNKAIELLNNIIENEYPNNRVNQAKKSLPKIKEMLTVPSKS